eukprot:Clim_evm7s153 gene=Clim_evmTU7s153
MVESTDAAKAQENPEQEKQQSPHPENGNHAEQEDEYEHEMDLDYEDMQEVVPVEDYDWWRGKRTATRDKINATLQKELDRVGDLTSEDRNRAHALSFSERQKHRKLLKKQIRWLMYGYGDVRSPDEDSILVMADIVAEYVTELASVAAHWTGHPQLTVSNVQTVLRRDRKKSQKVRRLLRFKKDYDAIKSGVAPTAKDVIDKDDIFKK